MNTFWKFQEDWLKNKRATGNWILLIHLSLFNSKACAVKRSVWLLWSVASWGHRSTEWKVSEISAVFCYSGRWRIFVILGWIIVICTSSTVTADVSLVPLLLLLLLSSLSGKFLDTVSQKLLKGILWNLTMLKTMTIRSAERSLVMVALLVWRLRLIFWKTLRPYSTRTADGIFFKIFLWVGDINPYKFV